MKEKYNSILQQQADEEKEYEKKQDKLKDKFGIKGKDVVVVERTNTFKFTINTFISLVCLVKNIIVLALALTGILALFYPAPRTEVLLILQQALDEIYKILPIEKFV
ncbi:hypothetical protein [Lacrimispora amygdalina]|uniref:hypothetical protein n=1 Tax=Lacrimispora amygdalina TaxID=253257 RepID=UPI000BE38466|nr:hypothetical protein [Lacrimispora amygdalina]